MNPIARKCSEAFWTTELSTPEPASAGWRSNGNHTGGRCHKTLSSTPEDRDCRRRDAVPRSPTASVGCRRSPEVIALSGHAARITAVAASRDGRKFATADSDGLARVWNRIRRKATDRIAAIEKR